jgi:hypothetical protein
MSGQSQRNFYCNTTLSVACSRYAWFAPRTDGFACLGPSANLLTDSNQLTTLGEIYVGQSIDEATLQEPIASAVLAPVARVGPKTGMSEAYRGRGGFRQRDMQGRGLVQRDRSVRVPVHMRGSEGER